MPTVTSRDGTRIAFERRGEGPAVALVDGTLGSRAVDFLSGLAAMLSKELTVYRYDRRGRNESGDTAPYAIEREVEDLEAIIDEAGGKAFVYGVSSGGALALEAASRLGPKVERLAAFEPPYGSPTMRATAPAGPSASGRESGYQARLEELLAAGRNDDALELFLAVTTMPADAIDRLRRSSAWQAMRASAPTLAYDARLHNGGAIPFERAASIKAPALVLAGSASPDWVRKTGRELAETMPNARYQELAGQNHNVNPRSIAPVLSDFFCGERAGVSSVPTTGAR